ncbi:MAG: mechanosensitive ion channel domain-containing protein [Desulfobacterales bacterium]
MTDGIMSKILKKIALGAAIVLASWSAVAAQQTSPSQETKPTEVEEIVFPSPTLDQLKASRAEAEAAMDLNESDKKNVLSFLDRGIRFLQETVRLNADIQKFNEKLKTAPARIEEIKTELSREMPAPDQIIDRTETSQMTSAELEQRRREERASLAALQDAFNNLQDQIAALKARPMQLKKESTDAMRRLQEVRQALRARADSPASDGPRMLAEARRTALLAEHAMLKAQIKSIEQQLLNQGVSVSLLTAERDLAEFEVSQRETRAQAWQAIARQRRQQEAIQARRDAEIAKSSVPDLPPVLKEQYGLNIKLGKDLEQLTADGTQTAQTLDRLQSELKTLEEEFAQIRQRVQGVSLSETIGLTLRQRRRDLPGPESYRRNSAQRQLIIGQVSEAQFIIDEKQRDLADIKAETDRILRTLPSALEENVAKWEERIRSLLLDRRDLLDKLENSYRRYYQRLQSLEFAEQRMSSLIDEYADFLDGRLLWLRSSRIIGPTDLRYLPAALFWIASPNNWWLLIKDLMTSFGRSPVIWILGLLIVGSLFVGRTWAKRNLEQFSKNVGSVRKDSFLLTLRALGLTLYLASSWPFMMVLAGWRLSALPFASDFSRAAGFGLLIAGHILGILNFLNYLCCEQGVAQVHFRWHDVTRLALRRQLLWLRPLWVSLIFLIATIEAANKITFGNSLGRLAFMVVIVASAVFAVKMFRITSGKSADTEEASKQGLLLKLRFLWYLISVGLPGLLVLLAAMGYFYTALQLSWEFHNTALLVIALVLGNNLALRWMVIAQRRLAYEETVRKRKEKLETERVQEGESLIDSIEIEEPEISQAQITEQTRSLLQILLFSSGLIGLWVIWNDVLPAMQMLEDIRLWGYSVEVDGVTKVVPITLTKVLLAVFIAIITFVGARNLPGVLEITLLKYLPLDAGARYAFSTICQYVVSGIGVIVALNYLGIDWGSLKWLVAALGVGIGFGLQEIIANFISGVIILFERPVRIGDIVTIGNIDGVISRIRIRATIITAWDRKEYLVPNKEFITGRVLNWTLSNAINRVLITAGIAYGSDTELARELLLKAAQEHPNVLEDPAPIATFEGFGDSALNFLLRCYLPNLDNRLVTITELHTAIDQAFRKAGITIAFPQRDLHLDSIHPLEVRGVHEQSHTGGVGLRTDRFAGPSDPEKI